jgi:hypothetical protein
MRKCVECGRQTLQPVCCHTCYNSLMERADQDRIPMVGKIRPNSKPIGFDPTRNQE